MSSYNIKDFILNALKEDIGRGDLFETLAPAGIFRAKIIAKDNGVLSGVKYIQILCDLQNIKYETNFNDGDKIKKGDILFYLEAIPSVLMQSERTILNILQHSSGIATNVSNYLKLLKDTDIILLDTRKTRPLLREFEKYSVLNGGGVNHRKGLDDTLMLKDTHLKTIKELKSFIKQARKQIPWTSKIEVECESFKAAKEAFEAKVDIVMCDNMSIKEIRKTVLLRDEKYKNILIEISGNITKENLLKYKDINIDAISSGSIIHQATWLDFSMRVE